MIKKYLKQKNCKARFLIGPNGSGKTYVMRKILLEHEGESILISEEGNLDIKMVRKSAVPDLDSKKYIIYPDPRTYGTERDDGYKKVSIPERLIPLIKYCYEQIEYYKSIRYRSKGQEKIYNMLNIIYKTVLNPIKLILIDEPENFMDDLGLRKVTKLFHLIEDAKIKLIISSHNYNLCNLLKVPIDHVFFIKKDFNEEKVAFSNIIKCISMNDVKKIYKAEAENFEIYIKGKKLDPDTMTRKLHLDDNSNLFELFLNDVLTSEQFYRALFYSKIILVEGQTEKRIINKLELSDIFEDNYFFICDGKGYIPFWAALFSKIGKDIRIIIDSDKKTPSINDKETYGMTCYLKDKYPSRVISFEPDLENQFGIDTTKFKHYLSSRGEKKLYASDEFFQKKSNLKSFLNYIKK